MNSGRKTETKTGGGRRSAITLVSLALLAPALLLLAASGPAVGTSPEKQGDSAFEHAQQLFYEGQSYFRYARMGSHVFLSREMRLHQAVREISPATALAVGLKVDSEALPPELLDALLAGEVDLDDPANTVALIRLRAVVGVMGEIGPNGELFQVGITCALCHSTVDDSVAPGVGKRLDGWANRDLDVGTILSLAPNLRPLADEIGVDVGTVKAVLASWGPGRFDAHLNLDGQAFRPDGRSASVLIPPAFGLAGVNLATYTGWGSVTYWNAFVANNEMGGLGRFFDPRLEDAQQFPVAAAAHLGEVDDTPDVVTSKLGALHFYQLALPAPPAPAGSYDEVAAERGAGLFSGKAGCARCHVPPLFTDPGYNLHTPEEIGIDDFQARRSPTGRYRTTPLKGLWTHMKGGFYHDGRFKTLREVVDHYDTALVLGLADGEKSDLVEYLKSL